MALRPYCLCWAQSLLCSVTLVYPGSECPKTCSVCFDAHHSLTFDVTVKLVLVDIHSLRFAFFGFFPAAIISDTSVYSLPCRSSHKQQRRPPPRRDDLAARSELRLRRPRHKRRCVGPRGSVRPASSTRRIRTSLMDDISLKGAKKFFCHLAFVIIIITHIR